MVRRIDAAESSSDPAFAQAEVEFESVRRVCHMACVPDAGPGDYVIVHAGVAICRIDAEEAARVLDELKRAGETPERFEP